MKKMPSCVRYYDAKQFGFEFISLENSKLSYPEHNHASVYVLGLVLRGEIMLKRRNASCICGSGSVFTVPPYEPHSVVSCGAYDMLCLCVNAAYPPFYDKERLQEVYLGIEKCAAVLTRKNLLSRKNISVLTQGLEKIFFCRAPLLSGDEAVDRVKCRIERFPEEMWNIEQMAQEVCMNKYRLIRAFHETVGLTPHQFQIQNRVRKAQRLLPEVPFITEAALSAGFYDQSHFIKHFKKLLGLVPKDYKAAYVPLCAREELCEQA